MSIDFYHAIKNMFDVHTRKINRFIFCNNSNNINKRKMLHRERTCFNGYIHCCNIVLQFTNKQQFTAHRVVRYGTHSYQVRHTTDVKYDTHSFHVRSYVNDMSQAIPIQGTNVSRTRLRSYVTNNAYDVL